MPAYTGTGVASHALHYLSSTTLMTINAASFTALLSNRTSTIATPACSSYTIACTDTRTTPSTNRRTARACS
eukprot:15067-Heterococcus_DN1.PRE.1